MTNRRFYVDEDLVTSCARSAVAAFVDRQDQSYIDDESKRERSADSDTEDQSCVHLFVLFAQHYGRKPLNKETLLVRNPTSYVVGSKMRAFLKSVILVERHNSDPRNKHRVALNQFSDRLASQVLAESVDSADLWSEKARRLAVEVLDDQEVDGQEWRSSPHRANDMISGALGGGTTVTLSTPERIIEVAANYSIGKGSMNQLYKYAKQHSHDKIDFDVYPTPIRLPAKAERDSDNHFQTPGMEPAMEGALLSIKRRKNRRHHERERNGSTDEFATYLNWATTENPDGVSLVHDPIDQGTCGSCWAYAAAGSLETNAARKEAYDAYKGYVAAAARRPRVNHVSLRKDAVSYAQDQERQSFQMLKLSIQELLDCDTAVDQGCIGGNPLLAFYFVHRYGLTSSITYPYVGFQDKCKKNLVNVPIATVASWGILPPNSEKHMELAVRHIGPIAVGVNGADPSFLSYDGGVFSTLNCKQGANHALLIVGYGSEETVAPDGRTSSARFWIARNSWGRGWGEDGFIRIKRGDGKKGAPSECGIARSPSVALGGSLLQYRTLPALDRPDGVTVGRNGSSTNLEKMELYTILENFCMWTGYSLESKCGRIADWTGAHEAGILGFLGLLATLSVVWPLTRDCRRRARLRRFRKMQRVDGHSKPVAEAESTSLLVPNEMESYGTYDRSSVLAHSQSPAS